MARTRPTVADLRAMKGKRQLTMLRVLTLEEAEAAERAGVDIVSIPPSLMLDPRYRDAAPSLFSMPGDNFYEIGTADDFVRWAFQLYKASADAVYCSASYATVKAMADENMPVIGHVGLIPSRKTWTGGFKAVGKTVDSAMQIFEAVRKYEAAGAFGAEIEVVPVEVAARSAGAPRCSCSRWARGPAATRNICSPRTCSAQSRPYAAPLESLPQLRRRIRSPAERSASRRSANIVGDVKTLKYPEDKHVIHMKSDEMKAFLKRLPKPAK